MFGGLNYYKIFFNISIFKNIDVVKIATYSTLKTENRKQKTENRKQKTENRKQKTVAPRIKILYFRVVYV